MNDIIVYYATERNERNCAKIRELEHLPLSCVLVHYATLRKVSFLLECRVCSPSRRRGMQRHECRNTFRLISTQRHESKLSRRAPCGNQLLSTPSFEIEFKLQGHEDDFSLRRAEIAFCRTPGGVKMYFPLVLMKNSIRNLVEDE